uniref:Uncharacterized protein n=1 Tax=Timema cristinae TaxID=61476 RepID=A0A7R9H2U6_TIMCR|nr:unnamed protein product [Timema cristinae]
MTPGHVNRTQDLWFNTTLLLPLSYPGIVLLMLAALLAVAAARPASKEESEYDYEEDVQEAAPPPPPPKAVGGRLSLLNSRTARGPSPLVSGRGAKAQQVTSKAPEPAPEVAEEVVYDDEPLEGEEVAEDVTTTTETPKKNLIRGGVRPFRSNDDLLAALKRRRQQMGSHVVSTYPTPAPTTSSSNQETPNKPRSISNNNSSSSRRRFTNNKASAAAGSSSDPVVAPSEDSQRRTAVGTGTTRRFSGRSKAVTQKLDDNVEVTEESVAKPKAFRGGRRL